MSTAYVCGFAEDTQRTIIPCVQERDRGVVSEVRQGPLDPETIEVIATASVPALVVAEIRDSADAALFRGLVSRAGDHAYVVGVPVTECALVSGLSRICAGGVFLLPAEKREVAAAVGHGARCLRRRIMQSRIDQGLRRQSLEIELVTRDVHVGETARSLADVLCRAGFARSGEEEDQLSVAMEEALINAIEHGNLDLDSALRPGTIGDVDLYEETRARRLAEPGYGDRLVFVSVETDPSVAIVSIRDQGRGFDHESLGRRISDGHEPTRREIMDVSGKGVRMIGRVFDSVRYDRKGTQIILEKRKDV